MRSDGNEEKAQGILRMIGFWTVGIENLTAFFMLMRRGGFIKSKNWGMTMDFFHDTLENGHRDM